MSEIFSVHDAQDALRHFFVEGQQEEFRQNFGNVYDAYPDFDIAKESEVFHEAAAALRLSVVVEVIDNQRVRIRKVADDRA
ncbi:hypothetical protein COU80_01795 [Candidatus Peregrinibacteria bacterium CG10_big_fil_rev_8_21_14_0_10_55_24]|nr:MAG: hypothetical protein COU80_01795 [Candidatus Peregrinibacteria bacterium CG10_big_fil_rev_8_21_14_0_10_55_24]